MPAVQAAVYEEFSRHIPGFKPLTDKELVAVMTTTTTAAAAVAPKANGAESVVAGGQQANGAPLTASEESWAILDEVYNKLQPFVEQCTGKAFIFYVVHFKLLLHRFCSVRLETSTVAHAQYNMQHSPDHGLYNLIVESCFLFLLPYGKIQH